MKLEKKIINKRGIIIVSILLGTLFVLTGCGKAEISVKTYDKENEVETSKIAEVENNTNENKTEENKVVENKTTEGSKEKNEAEEIKKVIKNTNWRIGTDPDYVENYLGILNKNGKTIYLIDCVDGTANGHLVYAVMYQDGKVHVSQPISTEYASVAVDYENGVIVVTGDVLGNTKLYAINGTEFVNFAHSEVNTEDGYEYWYVNNQNVSYGRYYGYFDENNLKEFSIKLTNDNIDKYIK